jgi:hypothetical protein
VVQTTGSWLSDGKLNNVNKQLDIEMSNFEFEGRAPVDPIWRPAPKPNKQLPPSSLNNKGSYDDAGSVRGRFTSHNPLSLNHNTSQFKAN